MELKNRASLGSLSDAWALGEFALDVSTSTRVWASEELRRAGRCGGK
jgi:hypothetical protein